MAKKKATKKAKAKAKPVKKTSKAKAKEKKKAPKASKFGPWTPAEQAIRKNMVRDLMLRSMGVLEIAQELGVNRQLVKGDVDEIMAGWKKRHEQEYDNRVAIQLAKLEAVDAMAFEAHDRSKKNGEEDTSILKLVQSGHAQIAKLLGLDKRPDEDSSVDDVPIITVIVESREDVARMQTATEFLATNAPLLEGSTIDVKPKPKKKGK